MYTKAHTGSLSRLVQAEYSPSGPMTYLRVGSCACPVLSTFQMQALSAVTASKVTHTGKVEHMHINIYRIGVLASPGAYTLNLVLAVLSIALFVPLFKMQFINLPFPSCLQCCFVSSIFSQTRIHTPVSIGSVRGRELMPF